jgi:hypothetical protein
MCWELCIKSTRWPQKWRYEPQLTGSWKEWGKTGESVGEAKIEIFPELKSMLPLWSKGSQDWNQINKIFLHLLKRNCKCGSNKQSQGSERKHKVHQDVGFPRTCVMSKAYRGNQGVKKASHIQPGAEHRQTEKDGTRKVATLQKWLQEFVDKGLIFGEQYWDLNSGTHTC